MTTENNANGNQPAKEDAENKWDGSTNKGDTNKTPASESGDPGRTPGSAEGDEETIDEDIREKEAEGKL